jgi:hypothetical protein
MSMGRVEEDRAAALAAFALGALAERVDLPGAGDNLRDFDLVFRDGHREPLEITADAHAPTEQSRARMGYAHFPAPELDRFWQVDPGKFVVDEAGVERAVDVRRIVREAPTHLSVLEKHGVARFIAMLSYREQPAVDDAARALDSLGIKRAYSFNPPANDHRLFIAAGSVGYGGADLIAEAVERQAADVGNQNKLAATGAARRHLLVTPVLSGGFAYFALLDILRGHEEELPRLPQLPIPITTAWAAAPSGAVFVTPPHEWQIVRTPEGFWDRYQEWLVDSG